MTHYAQLQRQTVENNNIKLRKGERKKKGLRYRMPFDGLWERTKIGKTWGNKNKARWDSPWELRSLILLDKLEKTLVAKTAWKLKYQGGDGPYYFSLTCMCAGLVFLLIFFSGYSPTKESNNFSCSRPGACTTALQTVLQNTLPIYIYLLNVTVSWYTLEESVAHHFGQTVFT